MSRSCASGTGAVRDAREATVDARTIELKPARRRKTRSAKASSAKARPIRRRKAA
jgi:hypothetical protein